MDDLIHVAAWGLLGVTIYAASKLSICLYSPKSGHSAGRCVGEAVLAVIVGVASAAAFGRWVAHFLHQSAPGDVEAVCAVIGLVANPTAPGMVAMITDRILHRVQG